MRLHPKLLAAGLVTLCGAGLAAPATLAADAAPAAEPGVWQKHEYSFEFMGFTSTYSCDGLADQLQRLLLLAGARSDAKAQPGACAAGFGRPDRFARATLVFYTLAPAAGGASGEAGVGRWRPVALAIHSPFELQAGDCELVEQFRDNVLRKMFSIRNVADNTRCIPHQESGSLIDLRFESFAPVADASAPVGTAPAARPRVYAYPKSGQTPAQQAQDRAECEASASAQSGFDAAAPSNSGTEARADTYARALTACLEKRGYSVK